MRIKKHRMGNGRRIEMLGDARIQTYNNRSYAWTHVKSQHGDYLARGCHWVIAFKGNRKAVRRRVLQSIRDRSKK